MGGHTLACNARQRKHIVCRMLTRIEIKNFRGLGALEIDLAQCSVLIGPNSCGKTTVLQAVQLACAALQFACARKADIALSAPKSGWLILYSDKPVRDDQAFLQTTRWTELFLDKNVDAMIQIILHFSEEHALSQLQVELYAGRADALRMTVSVQAGAGSRLRHLVDALAPKRGKPRAAWQDPLWDLLPGLTPRAIFIPTFYGVVRQEEYRAGAAVDALLQQGQQGQVVRNLLMRLPTLEGLNSFLSRAGLAAEMKKCTSRQDLDHVRYLEVLFSERNGPLELSSAGTGLASLAALYAAVQNYQDAVTKNRAVLFMCDEPEAHLHPRLQGDVAASLVDMIAGTGAQLLCATHSVEMINRFGRDDRALVLRIDRDREGQVRALHSENDRLDELGQWCDLSPFAKLNLLANRRIVFCEGPTDFTILQGCARLYLGGDLNRLRRVEVFADAQLDGTSNLGAKDVLTKALEPLFKVLPPTELVRVVRLLDRDLVRRPGQVRRQPSNKSRYEELDIVWSRYSIESLFLETGCLTEWLLAALNAPRAGTHPQATALPQLSRAEVQGFVSDAIAAADADLELNQQSADRLMPTLVHGLSPQAMVGAIKEARAAVEKEPAIYQRGHNRADFILDHVRSALFANQDTKALANRVKKDIAEIIRTTPLKPESVPPMVLFPDEVRAVLDFMAES